MNTYAHTQFAFQKLKSKWWKFLRIKNIDYEEVLPLPNTKRQMKGRNILTQGSFEAHSWTQKSNLWLKGLQIPTTSF
jgi:hypothetical protein